jgi:photosynthesis system II assembly factor YCF48-like protein
VVMTKPGAVPPSELTDRESSAQYQSAPLPAPAKPRAQGNGAAPPPVARELPQIARNYGAAPPLRDEKTNPTDAHRGELETRDDLSKRAEATAPTAKEKQAPAEVDAFSAAKRDEDLARAKSAPSAAPTPGTAGTAQAETKMQGTGAGVAGQKSKVGGMANSRNQKQTAADTNGAADVTVMSQVVTVQSAAQMIQTPDANVQYRIQGPGVVERSKDGGATWQGQRVKANAEILAGAAPSVNVCWLVGRGGVILMTSDGKKWKRIPSPAVVDFVEVTASDASFATVAAADGRKFSTQNGGMTWQLMK